MNTPTIPINTAPVPRWLGIAGLIPFAALAAAVWLWPAHAARAHAALLGYGAVILSFVGAIHWGLGMATAADRSGPYLWSVVPSLLGWAALLVGAAWGYPVLLLGLWAHYAQDRRWRGLATLAPWYLPLRTQLTLVASACLLLGWGALAVNG